MRGHSGRRRGGAGAIGGSPCCHLLRAVYDCSCTMRWVPRPNRQNAWRGSRPSRHSGAAMSHCPGCTKHYGPFPSCPGCGPEAELPIDPKRPTLRFPSTERVAALEAGLARLTTFEQLIGYAPTISCCQNALEHLGHLTARGERLTAAEAELATLRAA